LLTAKQKKAAKAKKQYILKHGVDYFPPKKINLRKMGRKFECMRKKLL